jgi:hypothetical protein
MIPFHLILNMIAESQGVLVDEISLQAKSSSQPPKPSSSSLGIPSGNSTSDLEEQVIEQDLNETSQSSALQSSQAEAEQITNVAVASATLVHTLEVDAANISSTLEQVPSIGDGSITLPRMRNSASELTQSEVGPIFNTGRIADDRQQQRNQLEYRRNRESGYLEIESNVETQSNESETRQRDEQRPQQNTSARSRHNYPRLLPTHRPRRLSATLWEFFLSTDWCLATGVGLMMFMVCLGPQCWPL